MTATEKRWRINRPDEQLVKNLVDGLKISSISAKILVARGFTTIEEARAFLMIDEHAIHDPFEMHGMKEAVERINKAIQNREKILIYGEYDAGATRS